MTDETTVEETEETPEVELERLREENQKFKDKDLNFAKLRESKEKAEGKIVEKEEEKLTLTEKMEKRFEAQEEKSRKWKEDQFSESKEEFFTNMCGEDQEMREKIEREMGQLRGDVNTVRQLKEKMERAHLLVEGSRPSPSVFGSLGTTSGPSKPSKKSYSDSDEGRAALRKITKGRLDLTKVKPAGTKTYFDNF